MLHADSSSEPYTINAPDGKSSQSAGPDWEAKRISEAEETSPVCQFDTDVTWEGWG